jgi:FkbM family methyltransferase
MLTTKTKISLAAAAQRVVSLARAVVGKNHIAEVERRKLRWRLDLREGIDFSIYLLGAFEPSTANTLDKLAKPGDVALDIGANIGAHTLGLARSVGPTGHVFAFEPTDFAFEKLRSNLALNPALEETVTAQQIYLEKSSETPVKEQIYASWPLETDEPLHPKHRGRLVSTKNARVDTLDGFWEREGLDRLQLIKLDVDGYELPVLQGGLKTLTRFRPTLVMEMSPYVHAEHSNSFSALVELLAQAGYSLLHADNWKSLPLDAQKLEAMIPDGASINVIARAS